MKNFLKQIVLFMGISIMALIALGYFINYRAEGEFSFAVKDTIVYSAPNLTEKIYMIESGETFTSLSNFDSGDSIKIRFENRDTDKEQIGFIHFSDCYSYSFPLSRSNTSVVSRPTLIMSVASTITFEEFLKDFVDVLDEYGVIGIYLEDSDYSEKAESISQISSFCEEGHIPYGFISSFTPANEKKYVDNMVNDDAFFSSYRILPHVFSLSTIRDGYKFRDELANCIFQTPSLRSDNIRRYWITSTATSHVTAENSVLLLTLKEDIGVDYVTVSSELEDEILNSFNKIESN